MDRYDKSELVGTDSDYLCVFCYDPLYVKDGTTEEACFNSPCPAYINRGEFSGDIGSLGWVQHAKKLCDESIRQFYKFERAFLLQKLFEIRASECEQIFQSKYASINIISSVDYLLTRLDTDGTWEGSKDFPSYLRALQQYYKAFEMVQVAENHCLKYYISNANADLYVMKYHRALDEFHKTLGIVGAEGRDDRAGCFLFNFIDDKSKGRPIEHPFDFDAICRSNPVIITQLNHVFRVGYTASQIHQYPARPEDFAALFSVWTRCYPNPAAAIDAEGLREIYDGASHMNEMSADFDQFLKGYTSGQEHAPILIFDGEKYHFEYHALLLYLLYLFSTNDTLSGKQTETGRTTYNDMRMVAAGAFEVEIREKLRNDGFEVLPAPGQGQLHIPSKKTGKEFDCVAVDREKKIVVLIEAKYEDMAPSSKAGTTMVDQLVLDKRRGLLGHAKKHHERRWLFKRHFASLKSVGLDLAGSFHDYVVHTAIVTKHEPVISRYMDVDIVSYKEFMSIDLRRHVGPLSCPAPSSDPSPALKAPPNAVPPRGGPGGKGPAASGACKDPPVPGNPTDKIASHARRGLERGRQSQR